MDIIFNEYSTTFKALDNEEANQWMHAFFEVLIKLEKRLHKKIRLITTVRFNEILLLDTYTFSQWLNTLNNRDLLRRIIGYLTHVPRTSSYPYYTYKNRDCHGLGMAYLENRFCISYPSSKWSTNTTIRKEYYDEATDEIIYEIYKIKNISSLSDVSFFYPNRVFEHHLKHDNRRPNVNDGESTLLYYVPEQQGEVQKLLDCAIQGGIKRLYNFDENVNLYMEFNPHGPLQYHGYHITDTKRIHPSIVFKIKEFKKL